MRLGDGKAYRHVVRCANECISITFGADEFSRDTEIAKLHLSGAGKEDVGGLDVTVDNLPSAEVSQPLQHAPGNLSKNLFAGTSAELFDFAVYAVETATLAEFHCDRDGAGGHILEGAVIFANIR